MTTMGNRMETNCIFSHHRYRRQLLPKTQDNYYMASFISRIQKGHPLILKESCEKHPLQLPLEKNLEDEKIHDLLKFIKESGLANRIFKCETLHFITLSAESLITTLMMRH